MVRLKREDKLTRAAHIKRHTVGTSNELSFSVLDAAKNQLEGDADGKRPELPHFGHISLFTLPFRRKKPAATPTKERGLPLSTGEFASVEDPSPAASLGTLGTGALGSSGPIASSPGMLDAADAPASPRRTASSAGIAPTVASVQRTPEEEIAHRKRRRRRHRRLAVAFVVVVTAALLAAGGTYLYQDNQRHLSQVSQIDDALSLIAQEDGVFVELDRALDSPFGAGAPEAYEALSRSVPVAVGHLDEADRALREAVEGMRESMQKDAANQAIAAVSARRTLADKGMRMLAAAATASEASAQLDEAWQHVLAADSAAREAAQLVADTTNENVQVSKEKTEQAAAAFTAARDELAAVQTSYSQADLEPLLAYVVKRIESLGYAIASDDAFLVRDKETAKTQNDAYNVADAEAAALAKALPLNPSDIIHEAFDQEISDLSAAYSTARLQAGSADAFIRDYLGTGIK